MPPHDLDEERALMRRRRDAQSIDRLECDIERRSGPDRYLGSDQIVIDRRGDADDRDVAFAQRVSASLRAVASDHDERVYVLRVKLLECRALPFVGLEGLAATRAEHRAALLDDPADIARTERDEVAGDQPGVAVQDAEHLVALKYAGSDHRADGGIHAGCIAPARHHCHALHATDLARTSGE